MVLKVTRADFVAASVTWSLELLERKVAALHAVPCFLSQERRLLRPLAERLTMEKVHADTVLLAQGTEATKLYVIGSGEARVLIKLDSGEVLQVPGGAHACDLACRRRRRH